MAYFRYQGFSRYTAKTGILLLSVVTSLLLPSWLAAEDEKTAEPDCGKAEIRYLDDPSLSRGERLVLMEKAFYDSINRFEACELTSQSASSGANSGGGDNGGGAEQSDGLSANSTTASQDLQGTDPALEMPPPMAEQSKQNDDADTMDSSASAGNGAIPEDIPSADNDDAVAAQIRLAAESETDPEIRQKLWNEYRKYKGLDSVE